MNKSIISIRAKLISSFTKKKERKAYKMEAIVPPEVLRRAFMFSQMTIHNEKSNSSKYEYLCYVEFLEMICRVAQLVDDSSETLPVKVQDLLAELFGRLRIKYPHEFGKPGQELALVPIMD